MSSKHPRPVTLGELVQRITNVEPSGTPPEPASSNRPDSSVEGVVSRRDERGLPYRGDFPNPAKIRGCF